MSQLTDILKQYWGHDQFRSLQQDIVESILDGNDTLALLPTGGGKSVCFQLPILTLEKKMCLVISPLIALMNDQIEHLKKQDIPAVMLSSMNDRRTQELILENCIQGAYRFLYISPERLTNDDFQQYLANMPVAYIAVDEAHCISQWGHDFRPSYLKIAEIKNILPNVPIVAVTATANNRVLDDIKRSLDLFKPKLFRKSFARENLSIVIRHSERKVEEIVHIITHIEGTGIIYVRNRRKTKEISEALNIRGFKTSYYHAGLTNDERKQRQAAWQKDEIKLMVCTNAFGMGIDKSNVRFVIHIDIPPSIEEYYQEIGRGGRDGKKSYAVLLINQADKKDSLGNIDRYEILPDELQDFYQFLFRFLNIAIHAGSEFSDTLDIKKLAVAYGQSVTRIHQYMMELDGLGLLEYNMRGNYYHMVKVIKDRTVLNRITEDSDADLLIKALLRRYNGIFMQKLPIDMDYLQKTLNKSRRWIVATLDKLEEIGIIDYAKANGDPYLDIIEDRLPSARSSFHFRHLSKKNKLKRVRLEAVLDYVEARGCKQQNILAYFDETGGLCGLCDFCTTEKSSKKTGFKLKLKEHIQAKKVLGYSDAQILMTIPVNKRAQAQEIIREQND